MQSYLNRLLIIIWPLAWSSCTSPADSRCVQGFLELGPDHCVHISTTAAAFCEAAFQCSEMEKTTSQPTTLLTYFGDSIAAFLEPGSLYWVGASVTRKLDEANPDKEVLRPTLNYPEALGIELPHHVVSGVPEDTRLLAFSCVAQVPGKNWGFRLEACRTEHRYACVYKWHTVAPGLEVPSAAHPMIEGHFWDSRSRLPLDMKVVAHSSLTRCYDNLDGLTFGRCVSE